MKNDRQACLKALAEAICYKCKRRGEDHIWRCVDCGDPLEKDVHGCPIFENHGLYAELTCPPQPIVTN